MRQSVSMYLNQESVGNISLSSSDFLMCEISNESTDIYVSCSLESFIYRSLSMYLRICRFTLL